MCRLRRERCEKDARMARSSGRKSARSKHGSRKQADSPSEEAYTVIHADENMLEKVMEDVDDGR